MELLAIVGGIVLGAVASGPVVFLLRRAARRRMGHAVASVVFAFVAIQGGLFAVAYIAPDMLLPVGASSVSTFLILVVVCALRTHEPPAH